MPHAAAARLSLRPLLALAIILANLAGLVIPGQALAQEPAPVVAPGEVDFAEELGAARLRGFLAGASPQILLGVPNLGAPSNHVAGSLPFNGQSFDVALTFDRPSDTLRLEAKGPGSTFSLEYPNFSAELLAKGKTRSIEDLNALQIGLVAQTLFGGATPAMIVLDDLSLNGASLGDFAASGGAGYQSWGVTGVDLGAGFVLRAKLRLFGDIGGAIEGTKLDLIFGHTGPEDSTIPTADLVDISPDPRTGGVADVVVSFSEPVIGVDLGDFSLTRDGAPVALAGAALSGSGASYTLTGLGAATDLVGSYELKLNAASSGIKDEAGNGLVDDAGESWARRALLSVFAEGACVSTLADGRLRATFGYTNDNPYTVGIPVGPNNRFNPDAEDRAQPTAFLTGRHTFSVDFAGGQLTWSADGKSASVNGDNRCDTAAPTADIVDVTPDPHGGALASIAVSFSESVTGVDLGDFSLTRDGAPVALAGATLTGSGASYVISGLAGATDPSGAYELKLNAGSSGIVDATGNGLAGDAGESWVTDSSIPVADIVDVTPDPRGSAVASIAVSFSESVTGVDLGDFSLTRDGAPVALAGATLTGSGAAYTLGGLSALTGDSGLYELKLALSSSGIVDGAGNSLSGDAVESWTTDSVAPTADIVDITPDPRTTTVHSVTVVFSEPVTGVDLTDFRMIWGNLSVPLVGPGSQATISGSGTTYVIDGLATRNLLAGTYTLTLRTAASGIVDGAGNRLASNASDSWERLRRLIVWSQTCVIPGPDGSFIGGFLVENPNDIPVTIPVGPDNHFDPDPDDRGQPTTFPPGPTNVQVAFTGPGLTWTLNDLNGWAFPGETCDMTPPTADIVDVTPDPRTAAVASVEIVFSEPVDGFEPTSLSLTRDGVALDLSGATLTGSGDSYTLAGLEALTEPLGDYTLTLIAADSDIEDDELNALESDASDSWSRVNAIPTAGDDSYTVDEDQPLVVAAPGVLANDGDTDGDPLTLALVGAPEGLTLSPDGGFSYTPAANFNGSFSFEYTLDDGRGGSTTGTVAVSVTPVNDPPVAVDVSLKTLEDQALTLPAPGVLAQSQDVDGDALKAALVDQPDHGTLTLADDGSLVYTPEANYYGADSFTFAASDGAAQSAAATVSIEVEGVNDAPGFTAGQGVAVLEDEAYSAAWATGVSAGPNEAAQGLTFEVTTDNPSLFAAGPSIAADGTLSFTPTADDYGEATVSVRLKDDGGTDNGGADEAAETASFVISVAMVNDPPRITPGGDVTVDEDSGSYNQVWATGLGAGPTEEAWQRYSVKVVGNSNPDLFQVQPVVKRPSGRLLFTPMPDANGEAEITLRVKDSGGTERGGIDTTTVTFKIVMLPVNDAPVANNEFFTMAANTSLKVEAPGVLANDFDVDGDAPRLSLVGQPRGVTLNDDGSFTFTPPANASGMVSWSYTYDDQAGGTDTGTVTVNVVAGDRVPALALVARSGVCLAGNVVGASMLLNVSDENVSRTFLSYKSSNPLIRATFSGQGAQRKVTFNVAPGAGAQAGTVTLTVRDAVGLTSSMQVQIVAGTEAGEVLEGTGGSDVLFGLGGDDRLVGLGGNDLLCGGAGSDTLLGGGGEDTLGGGADRDSFDGGPGTDLVRDRAQNESQVNIP